VNGSLLLLTWLAPLLLAPFALRCGRRSRWPVPMATLPALLTASAVPTGTHIEVPWLLLGAQFGLDGGGRVFLSFTALLWLVAGLQAELTMRDDPHLRRFRLFFMFAMAGNFWLIVGQDLVNFYLGFTLMGFAAYGLVIHNGAPASLRAGRVYLAMTLVAEAALLAAFLLIFSHTNALAPVPIQLTGLGDWAIGLLVFGLAIKAGLVPLHVWLPLAHPAAPVAASAVLSGTMIKAALIGLLRFLPLGQEALWEWGNLLAVMGTASVLCAIPLGLVQTNPKVVLAYSSVGKMGLMMAMLGLAMAVPSMMPAIFTALVFYAAHHGLAKGALFLGVGVAQTSNASWVLLVLAIPALVLAGAPFTSGALAKALVKPSLIELQGFRADAMLVLLVISSIGTTLLMARFLTLLSANRSGDSNVDPWSLAPWLLLIAIIFSMPFVTGFLFPSITASWPLAAGSLLALLAALLRPRWAKRLIGSIPAGDVIEPLLRLTQRLRRWRGDSAAGRFEWQSNVVPAILRRVPYYLLSRTTSAEQVMRLGSVAGVVVLGIIGTLLFLLWVPG